MLARVQLSLSLRLYVLPRPQCSFSPFYESPQVAHVGGASLTLEFLWLMLEFDI